MSAFEPGEIYSYSYLWSREHQAGEESGRKARPSCLVFRSTRNPSELYLFPITTRQPSDDRLFMQIGEAERKRAGLSRISWIILDEFNVTLATRKYDFASTKPLGRFSTGFLDAIAAKVAEAMRQRAVRPVARH